MYIYTRRILRYTYYVRIHTYRMYDNICSYIWIFIHVLSMCILILVFVRVCVCACVCVCERERESESEGGRERETEREKEREHRLSGRAHICLYSMCINIHIYIHT